MTNIKSPRAFQRAIDGVRMLPLSPERVAQKAIFFVFEQKSTADRLRRCQNSSPVSVIWSAAMLITSTVEISI